MCVCTSWFHSSDIIPRSVLMVSFSGTSYLLCALGDGCLLYYILDPDSGETHVGILRDCPLFEILYTWVKILTEIL